MCHLGKTLEGVGAVGAARLRVSRQYHNVSTNGNLISMSHEAKKSDFIILSQAGRYYVCVMRSEVKVVISTKYSKMPTSCRRQI